MVNITASFLVISVAAIATASPLRRIQKLRDKQALENFNPRPQSPVFQSGKPTRGPSPFGIRGRSAEDIEDNLEARVFRNILPRPFSRPIIARDFDVEEENLEARTFRNILPRPFSRPIIAREFDMDEEDLEARHVSIGHIPDIPNMPSSKFRTQIGGPKFKLARELESEEGLEARMVPHDFVLQRHPQAVPRHRKRETMMEDLD